MFWVSDHGRKGVGDKSELFAFVTDPIKTPKWHRAEEYEQALAGEL
jgi:hypothetical protein